MQGSSRNDNWFPTGVRGTACALVAVASMLVSAICGSLRASAAGAAAPAAEPPVVEDLFGRALNQCGITIVDWEGYLANPAVKLTLQAPSEASFPLTVNLSAPETRLYFDMPCEVGEKGPRKTLRLLEAGKGVPFFLAIFPDRDGANEEYQLALDWTDSAGRRGRAVIPVHVVDQDRQTDSSFQVAVDFAYDRSGFFNDPLRRRVVQQAADDWAYFIDGSGFDPVAPMTEATLVWMKDWKLPPPHGPMVPNQQGYRGFWIQTVGLQVQETRASGAGTYSERTQSAGGRRLPLARSGNVTFDPRGNFYPIGWLVSLEDRDWWKHTGQPDRPDDLLSIAHHEIGHALAFNAAHPGFKGFKSTGRITGPYVQAYHGSDPRLDQREHMAAAVDRMSRKGGFGQEYNALMPARRFLATKLDLLALNAIGYPLRMTSCLAPLSTGAEPPPAARRGVPYRWRLEASGGVPDYYYRVSAGALPAGLLLDSFTGTITGTPSLPGTFDFTIQIQDQDDRARPLAVQRQIRVAAG